MTANGSLTSQLERLCQDAVRFLASGKDVLKSMESGQAGNHVTSPLLLRLALEKTLEIIEEKLLPHMRRFNVEPGKALETPTREAPLKRENTTDPTLPKRSLLVDDFSNTHPSRRPVSRSVGTAPKTEKPNPGIEKKHRVDDFRNTDKTYRPRPGAKTPGPSKPVVQASAKPGPVTAAPQKPPQEVRSERGKLDARALVKSKPDSRRTIPRFNYRMPLQYKGSSVTSTPCRAYTKDVGARGLFIMANRPEKTGNSIEIEVEMPDHQKAVLQAVVQWTKWVPPNLRNIDQPGFGVKIVNASSNWYTFFIDTLSVP